MNKKNPVLIPIVFLMLCLLSLACKKDAGPGGLATIKGKVYGRDVTSSGNLKAEGYIGDVRVYISVAGNPSYFDDTRTSYDGSYEFRFLRKGSYDLWVYSDCDTCAWKQKYEVKSVEISSKKETVTVPDFNIIF